MNNFKFRAYDPDMEEMHRVDGFENGKVTVFINEPSIIDGHNDIHPIKDIVLMQYTGFKDKEGREIYEGDILQHWLGMKYEIVFDNSAFMLKNIENNSLDYLREFDMLELKVIGCIYDSWIDYNNYYD